MKLNAINQATPQKIHFGNETSFGADDSKTLENVKAIMQEKSSIDFPEIRHSDSYRKVSTYYDKGDRHWIGEKTLSKDKIKFLNNLQGYLYDSNLSQEQEEKFLKNLKKAAKIIRKTEKWHAVKNFFRIR